MKVVRFYAPGDLRYEDADEPTPGPDEVKIKVWATSTCGTDVKIFGAGHQNLDPPRVIGHEIAGEVVEVGSGVDGWQPGDRVQVIAAVGDDHIGILSKLAMILVDPDQAKQLREASDTDTVLALLQPSEGEDIS